MLIQCIPLGFALIFILGIICSGFGLEGDNSEQLSYTDEDNYTETLTIYHDEIPLSLEDLGVTVKGAAHTDSYATHNSSIFGSLDEYSQSFLNEKLECIGEGMELDIIESSFAWGQDVKIDEKNIAMIKKVSHLSD